jgi:hypothetical protein
MTAGNASTHHLSPSAGEIAMATAAVSSPPAVATTTETPASWRGVARLRASSTALATQTDPNGTWQMPTLSDASA